MGHALGLLCFASTALAQGTPGEVVVAFEVWSAEGDTADICAQRLAAGGELLWGEDDGPVTVAASPQAETSPVLVPAGNGAVILVYQVTFTAGEHAGDADLFAQLIDADGAPVWNGGDAPTPVATSQGTERAPAVIPDGEGGAIVVYEWADGEGDSDILAQRIGADGEAVWNGGETPAIIAASDAPEHSATVVSDGEGGAIVVFVWEGPDGNADIMAQRVAADGSVVWNEGTQAVDISATPMREAEPTAVTDGRGGALVAFELEFLEGKYKGDVDIMAQRISADGVRSWNGGEEPSAVSSGSGIERHAMAVSDGERGMIVAFEYEPLEGEYAGDVDVLAQRLGPTGRSLWHDGERATMVSSSPQLERAVFAISDGAGGLFAAFEHEFRGGDYGGDVDIFGQRVAPDGQLVWNDGDQSQMIAGSEWYERAPVLVPDGGGGFMVIAAAEGPEGKWEGDEDVRAVRVDEDGGLPWHDGQKAQPVSATTLFERNPAAVLVE